MQYKHLFPLQVHYKRLLELVSCATLAYSDKVSCLSGQYNAEQGTSPDEGSSADSASEDCDCSDVNLNISASEFVPSQSLNVNAAVFTPSFMSSDHQ